MVDTPNPFHSPPKDASERAPTLGPNPHYQRNAIVTLAVIPIVGFFFLLSLWSFIQNPRPEATKYQDRHNLKQIALGLHNYLDTYGKLPPACVTDSDGKPLYSWRVLILPMVGEGALHKQFDLTQAWDSPVNLPLVRQMPDLFRSPNRHIDGATGQTPYQALVDESGSRTLIKHTTARSLATVGDGTSNTAMLIANNQDPVCWTEPNDTDPAKFLRRFRPSEHEGEVAIAYGDGSAQGLGENLRIVLPAAMYANDGKVPQR
ncbi:DUF1559 domain-containing protein [Bremerella cremea]|uniref:DUF1559 domain-containing protein n=1 Tax=Bremerella cremea TaxID=1031537 RepID=A0A368KJE1_9BACT|nr:DUF1559 domain-containing protein [Bremerella cremea]RCS40674.1 DUF1559 domain-containing protein [Bremerella cremea]